MPGALHSIDMGQAQRTTSTDSADALRKRVCKACDRCRLKKSKCDGASPCSRCKTDNAICVFGERKKSHDKVYPKGYVEMLEQQQGQLVSGLQELYHRMYKGERWPGSKLSESNGHPLTHDILAALGLLEPKADGSGEMEVFEEDTEKIQSRLLAEGAGYVRRRGSFSSDSEHSQHSHNKRHSHGTPSVSRQPTFDRNFSFTASPSPVTQSPAPRQRVSYPTAQDSPLHRGQDLNNNLSLFHPEWSAQPFMDTGSSKFMRPEYAMRTSQPDQSLDMTTMDFLSGGNWGEQVCPLDLSMDVGMYQQQLAANQYTSGVDFNTMQMDLDSDFKQFIQVTS